MGNISRIESRNPLRIENMLEECFFIKNQEIISDE